MRLSPDNSRPVAVTLSEVEAMERVPVTWSTNDTLLAVRIWFPASNDKYLLGEARDKAGWRSEVWTSAFKVLFDHDNPVPAVILVLGVW